VGAAPHITLLRLLLLLHPQLLHLQFHVCQQLTHAVVNHKRLPLLLLLVPSASPPAWFAPLLLLLTNHDYVVIFTDSTVPRCFNPQCHLCLCCTPCSSDHLALLLLLLNMLCAVHY
jgi:hypothetical protein